MPTRFRAKQTGPLDAGILGMMPWIDPPRPNHDVVPYEVVAATTGIGPHGPTCRIVQGNRLPIEVNVPPTGVEGQYRQIAATAGTAQVDCSILVADPKFAGFDCVELGQYLYEDGTEFQERHSCHSSHCDDARCLESELMEERSGLRNILLCSAPPFHHGE